ncbi:hypothetical protein Fmac_029329 [Flemingia macrophylla]|uniref:CASP-like protein n=1 Tax=Flemingia macrophylla TaxID=520843 RepID=A0ABD1LBK3_9FABA
MDEPKDSSIGSSKSPRTSISQHRTLLIIAQDILRILAALLSAASIAVMVTNNQTVFLFAIPFEAHFYYQPTLKFFVAANGVVASFSLLTLIMNLLLLKRQPSPTFHFFVFVHDIVLTVLLIAGCAAATAIGYVGQYGEDHVGWQPICDHLRKFCRTNLVSLLLSYFSFFAYFAIILLSPFKCPSSSSPNN